VLLVLVLVSVTVISLDESSRTHDLTAGVKSVATDAFTPLRSGVDGIVHPIGDFFAGAFHYGALQQENQKLRSEIAQLELGSAEASHAREELAQLDRLLQSHALPSLGSLHVVTARTVAVGSSDFTATITIDKGRDQGVAVTDPVVGGGGLVGRVIQASHSTATVELITAGQSTVGVTFGSAPKGPYTAVVQGQGAGSPMKALYVSPTAKVHVHEEMYTNGYQGAAFPQGIPVGRVTSARTVPGATEMDVHVAPAADLSTLAYLQVLQWSPAP
jgi:rod shape-determining protein MreC